MAKCTLPKERNVIIVRNMIILVKFAEGNERVSMMNLKCTIQQVPRRIQLTPAPMKNLFTQLLDITKPLYEDQNLKQPSVLENPRLVCSSIPVQVVNIMDMGTFSKLSPAINLQRTSTKIHAYGNVHSLLVEGKFTTMIETKERYATATFYVVQGCSGCLLSYDTASDLGLIILKVMQSKSRSLSVMSKVKGK